MPCPRPYPWRPRPPRTPGSPWPPAAGSRLTSNPGTQFSAAPLPGSGSSSDRQVPEKVVERVCVCARVEEGGGKRKIIRASPTQCHRGQSSAPYRPVRLHLVVELGSPVLQILRTGEEAGVMRCGVRHGCGVPSSFCATYLLQVRHARQELVSRLLQLLRERREVASSEVAGGGGGERKRQRRRGKGSRPASVVSPGAAWSRTASQSQAGFLLLRPCSQGLVLAAFPSRTLTNIN